MTYEDRVTLLAATLLCELGYGRDPRGTDRAATIQEVVRGPNRPFRADGPRRLTLDEAHVIVAAHFSAPTDAARPETGGG